MSDIIKIIELMGCSTKSFDDALKALVKRANQTLKEVSGVDVIGQTAEVKNGKIVEYKVNAKVAFKLTK